MAEPNGGSDFAPSVAEALQLYKNVVLSIVRHCSEVKACVASDLPSDRAAFPSIKTNLAEATRLVVPALNTLVKAMKAVNIGAEDEDEKKALEILFDIRDGLRASVACLFAEAEQLFAKGKAETLNQELFLAVMTRVRQSINIVESLVQLEEDEVSDEDESSVEAPEKLIPVTVITGFLGSGKTTLLNYILSKNHGKRIAVIENEFGEVGIDDALIKDKFQAAEEIFEMNNGCICCTVRGDLIRILSELLKKKDKFDYVMIETTGLADPAPIAQTFMTVPKLARVLRMDGIITVVDAKHILQHLEEEKPEGVENESVEQVAFADKILLNKIDLVQPEDLDHVIKRIKSISSTVDIIKTQNSVVDLDKILNIRAFDLSRIMDMDPEFLLDQDHEHDQSVSSVGILVEGEADINKLESWIGGILRELGADIFRMKGVIAIKGQAKRYVFQGVHMLFGGSPQLPWQAGEKRVNKMVFIGRNLNRAMLVDGFNACLVK